MSELVYQSWSVVARLGGKEELARLREKVEGLALGRCPFCGGEAEVFVSCYGSELYFRARCRDCHGAAADGITHIDGLTGCADYPGLALSYTVERWNRREGRA